MRERHVAKGYWLVSADVTDPEGYKQYLADSGKAFAKFGGRFLARGGASEQVEGSGRSRFVVLEFKDYATALECYRSPEYSVARAARRGRAVFDLVITDGYDGPQPAS
jgi:uncharacterized protein (DUF1330 family)